MLPGSESTGQDGRRAQPGERAGCCFPSDYKYLGVWSPHLDSLRLLSQYPIQISPDFTQFPCPLTIYGHILPEHLRIFIFHLVKELKLSSPVLLTPLQRGNALSTVLPFLGTWQFLGSPWLPEFHLQGIPPKPTLESVSSTFHS